eukprot:10275_1
MALILSEELEYRVPFEKKPFGMTWASRKSDRKNLYVTKIDVDSPAFYKNVITGSKLIAFEDESIEDLGAKEIFWQYKNKYDDTLPLHITFRKPEEDPSSPAISRTVSVFQHFEPNEIEFPVDCGANAMKYSSPTRLQEMFIAVLQYMAKATNTPSEWVQFISDNDYQVLIRFAKTTKRLLQAEIDETESKTNNEDESSAFGWLCVILKMFGDLDVANFVEIITQYTLKNIITSLSHHDRLSRQDCMNRVDAVHWMVVGNTNLTHHVDDAFLGNLCRILNENEYNDVIQMSSKSLIYGIARKHKSEIKDALLYIQDTLSDDSFRHFTEFYFDLLNNLDYNDEKFAEFELLIEFNAFVFRYNLYTFYFSSDIQILIEIYIRSLHNCQPSSQQLLLCLDGLYNIIRWKGYAASDGLNKYKLDQILNVLCHELQKKTPLIRLIDDKVKTIAETLAAIKENQYDYDSKAVIELPIDISEYALKTKSMKQLQTDLIELIYFLQHNTHNTASSEWITFLTANNFEVYKRFCVVVIRLLQSEKKYIAQEEEEKEDENTLDTTQLFPLTSVCQLLVLFASLDPAQFSKMIKLRVLNPLRASLSYANKLQNADDVLIRLRVLFFMINNDDSLQIAFEWLVVLCKLLPDKRDKEILVMTTKCITFAIGKMSDEKKQKQFLLHLANNLKNDDDFRHFIEVYIQLINEVKIHKWQDMQTKLLINFAVCVMRQQMEQFFFTSDVKILCQIYLRCCNNIDAEMDPHGFVVCLNAIKALCNWNPYMTDTEHTMFRYKYDEITNQLRAKASDMQQNDTNQNAFQIINQISNI